MLLRASAATISATTTSHPRGQGEGEGIDHPGFNRGAEPSRRGRDGVGAPRDAKPIVQPLDLVVGAVDLGDPNQGHANGTTEVPLEGQGGGTGGTVDTTTGLVEVGGVVGMRALEHGASIAPTMAGRDYPRVAKRVARDGQEVDIDEWNEAVIALLQSLRPGRVRSGDGGISGNERIRSPLHRAGRN